MYERKRRNIIIGTLCTILLLMVIGYAAFNTLLNIEGTTNITSSWDIKITGITSKDIIGSAYDVEDPTHTELEATFKTGLISPGDSITYDITVENQGNLDAYLQTITINKKDNPAIIFESSGLEENDKLGPGESKILTIKVTFNEEVTEMPENKEADFNVGLEFNQTVPIIDATPVVTYKCPSGYSQSGSGSTMKCSRTVQGSVITNCPSGCTVSGKSCSGTYYVPPICSNYSYYRLTQTSSGGYICCKNTLGDPGESYCPEGTTFEGRATPKTSCGQYTVSGYTSTICKGTCSSSNASYSCSSGYSKSGDGTSTKCTKTETATRQEITTYTCPDGYALKDTNKCYKE